MKKRLNNSLLLLVFLLPLSISAQNGTIPSFREKGEIPLNREKFHLYLLVGQSNMAGRGIVEPQDTIGNPRILRMNREGIWEIAKDPVHYDKTFAGVGLGLSFAREMLSVTDDDVVIGLIPCAVGGSGIDFWRAGAFYDAVETYPYDVAIRKTRFALKYGVLKGILWHQGESDSYPDKTPVYKDKLVRLVADFRKEFDSPKVPFIAGEIPNFQNKDADINKALHEAQKDIPFYEIVSAEGFKALPDNVHIDAVSLREFGKRYAEKMKIYMIICKNTP